MSNKGAYVDFAMGIILHRYATVTSRWCSRLTTHCDRHDKPKIEIYGDSAHRRSQGAMTPTNF